MNGSLNVDQDLSALAAAPPRHAPTMGNLAKIRYTHADMIDFIVANPATSQNELALRYGYSPSWISNVMASDAFQSALAARREELVDPALRATLEERYRGLAIHSLQRLMERLDKPNVSDNVILRAAELGAKSVGVGGHAPPPPPPGDQLAKLADRLLELQGGIRQRVIEGVTYDAEIVSQGG